MNFPVHFSSQLREHLRALRKARGLTQAALGQLLGVGQARIAEIESNPGVVSVEQLMKVLSVLRASVWLRDDDAAGSAGQMSDATKCPGSPAPKVTKKKKPVPRLDIQTSAAGQRRAQPSPGRDNNAPQPALPGRTDARASTDGQTLRDANPQLEGPPPLRRNFIIRPKRGSW